MFDVREWLSELVRGSWYLQLFWGDRVSNRYTIANMGNSSNFFSLSNTNTNTDTNIWQWHRLWHWL